MDAAHKQVSVIIVTFNSLPSLKDSLVSLKNSDISENLEIIIVDNNSTDRSIEIAREIFADCKIIQNNRNIGFAAACNKGAKEANGEYLLFFNPDLEIDKDAISILVDRYEKLEKAGALAGRMRFPDNSFQPTCRKFPTYKNIFFSRGSVLGRIFKSDIEYTLPDYESDTEVEAVAGTFLLVSKTVFERVKMFDETFFMYMEDTDLSYKLNQAGYKNYFIPQAGGVHLWGKGSSGGKAIRSYYHHRSVWKYFLKYFPNAFSLLILPLILLVNFLLGLLIPAGNK